MTINEDMPPVNRILVLEIKELRQQRAVDACEIEKLRSQLALAQLDSQLVRFDRDIARRQVCYSAAEVKARYLTAREYAARADWDCFKEENHNA